MKYKIFFSIVIIVTIWFVGYSILHPFSMTSSGSKEMVEDPQNQAKTYYFNIENNSYIPATLIDFEIVGYSGMTIIDKKIDLNKNIIKLTCEAKKDNNESLSDPAKLHLSYNIYIFKFTQELKI